MVHMLSRWRRHIQSRQTLRRLWWNWRRRTMRDACRHWRGIVHHMQLVWTQDDIGTTRTSIEQLQMQLRDAKAAVVEAQAQHVIHEIERQSVNEEHLRLQTEQVQVVEWWQDQLINERHRRHNQNQMTLVFRAWHDVIKAQHAKTRRLSKFFIRKLQRYLHMWHMKTRSQVYASTWLMHLRKRVHQRHLQTCFHAWRSQVSAHRRRKQHIAFFHAHQNRRQLRASWHQWCHYLQYQSQQRSGLHLVATLLMRHIVATSLQRWRTICAAMAQQDTRVQSWRESTSLRSKMLLQHRMWQTWQRCTWRSKLVRWRHDVVYRNHCRWVTGQAFREWVQSTARTSLLKHVLSSWCQRWTHRWLRHHLSVWRWTCREVALQEKHHIHVVQYDAGIAALQATIVEGQALCASQENQLEALTEKIERTENSVRQWHGIARSREALCGRLEQGLMEWEEITVTDAIVQRHAMESLSRQQVSFVSDTRLLNIHASIPRTVGRSTSTCSSARDGITALRKDT
jgi:hypothetical protein